MTTHVWDYLPEYENERDDIHDAVETVLRSGQLVLGGSVRGFEEEFAAYHGLAHCVGVDNGTNAIKLGLQACGIGPGDEVITVSNTAAPTVVAIDGTGATPVFVDVDPDTYLMRVDQVEAAITPRTRALLPVHLYGQCVDMAPLQALAERHGLVLFEDCAQAHGARHHGRLAGTMGRAAAFSFYPTKVLGAYGDGGATVTSDDEVERNLRRLRYYGMEERYYVVRTPATTAVWTSSRRRSCAASSPGSTAMSRADGRWPAGTRRAWATPSWCCRRSRPATTTSTTSTWCATRGATPSSKRSRPTTSPSTSATRGRSTP